MNENNYGFGGWGIVILIAIFFLLFGGRGWGNDGNRVGEAYATQADVQRATDFQSLERQNNEIVAATRQGVYDVAGAIKDGNYNILGELRDLQRATAGGFSTLEKCCCEQLRAIDGVNYNAAISKGEIVAAIHSEGEATRNLMQAQETQRLRDELTQERAANNDYRQSQYLLGQLGRYWSNPPCAGPACGGCNGSY